MRVLILGGDGYLGWPTAMDFATKGHQVCVVDNYLRRNIARETCSEPLMINPNLIDRSEIFKSLSVCLSHLISMALLFLFDSQDASREH